MVQVQVYMWLVACPEPLRQGDLAVVCSAAASDLGEVAGNALVCSAAASDLGVPMCMRNACLSTVSSAAA